MSVFSAKTGLSSILKAYSPDERIKAKNAIINKVRFEMPKQKSLAQVVEAVQHHNDFQAMEEFVAFIQETELSDVELQHILSDARLVVNDLSPKFTRLVEALLAQPWTQSTPEVMETYSEFCIDILVVHSKYIQFGIQKLISLWIPGDNEEGSWPNGTPDAEKQIVLQTVHRLLERILTIIPMSFNMIQTTIESMFPYFKKPTYVVAGYLHNVLWISEYKPIFTDFVVELLFRKLVYLDVNAPRNEIEDAEDDGDDSGTEDDNEREASMDNSAEEIFQMDDCNKDELPMNHPIAHTLDVCMEKFFVYLGTKNQNAANLSGIDKRKRHAETAQFMKVLQNSFDNVLLPTHNTHHVQFLMFYFCSFKPAIAETFLSSLWSKLISVNVSAVIRQAAVGYIASFLARSKFVPIDVLKQYLKLMCDWAHQYMLSSEQYNTHASLKANMVFFTVCQAIFYVIAFRSRDLTADRSSLLFLQTLHLSGLVTSNYNPLRVCLPAVATAFAGVTRTYQLAYCHAILERNARRKLATVYANDTSTPEETLDTFFPFDPYLLKLSGARIAPHYLQYKASAAEEQTQAATLLLQRKRGDSEMIDDLDIDDFLVAEKRQKFDLAKSQEREAQFTYGLSPGFHT